MSDFSSFAAHSAERSTRYSRVVSAAALLRGDQPRVKLQPAQWQALFELCRRDGLDVRKLVAAAEIVPYFLAQRLLMRMVDKATARLHDVA